MKTIEVTFDDKGDPKVETTGFTGGDCIKTTKGLEEALGKVECDKKKAEFHGVGVPAQGQQARQ